MIGLLTRRLREIRAEAPYSDYSPAVYRAVYAAPTGVMVAYARESLTVSGDLEPFLARWCEVDADPFLTKALPKGWEDGDERADVYRSVHGRPHSRGGRPGDIELHHLWLSGLSGKEVGAGSPG